MIKFFKKDKRNIFLFCELYHKTNFQNEIKKAKNVIIITISISFSLILLFKNNN